MGKGGQKASNATAVVNSGVKSVSWRYQYEYTYDSNVVSNTTGATAVILFIVGTAMSVSQYSDLAAKCTAGSRTVFVVVDNSPNFFVKFSPLASIFGSKTATALNDFVANITTRLGGITSNPDIFVGGHSAGGYDVIEAMNSKRFTFTPAGCLNADPFGPFGTNISKMDKIEVPAFSIGFTEETCKVTPSKAGLAAHNLCINDNRVMMQLVNDTDPKIQHCFFTNGGCGPVCSSHKNGDWEREVVGKFTILFVNSIVKGVKTSKYQYEEVVKTSKNQYEGTGGVELVNVFYSETAVLP